MRSRDKVALNQMVYEYVMSRGGLLDGVDTKVNVTKTVMDLYHLSIETLAGWLTIHPHGTIVFTCFSNVEKAKRILEPGVFRSMGANPYSGKWNFHFNTRNSDALVAFQTFRRELDKILPPQ